MFISPQNEFQTTAWRRDITDCQNAILRHLLHKLVIRVGTLSCLSIDANQAPDRQIHTLNIQSSLNEQSHDAGARSFQSITNILMSATSAAVSFTE